MRTYILKYKFLIILTILSGFNAYADDCGNISLTSSSVNVSNASGGKIHCIQYDMFWPYDNVYECT